MNKTKYNEHFPILDNNTEQHGSYIQNYLGNEINALLASSANQINGVNFEDIYIHNVEMEAVLEKYLKHTYSNNTCIIEGLTGTGKTMLMRHVFQIHNWTVHVIGNSIIIPFSFDNALYADVKEIFTRMMHGACDYLLEHYPSLRRIDDCPEEFYDYIKNHRQDLAHYCDRFPSPTKMEQLQALLERKPLAFYSSQFKFYLGQTDTCPLDNVVFVVDDIEGIRSENDAMDDLRSELLPIKMVLELTECMQNQSAKAASWSLNTVICCRHYVSRMMRTLPFSLDEATNYIQKLEAYAICARYDLSKTPSIIEIIKKRYGALTAIENNRNDDKWTVAMQVVMQILEQVDSKMTDFILDLTLGNVREAMNWIKRLILNKRWIQRDYEQKVSGAFVIKDLNQYSITSASLIRGIGMNESIVYNSKESIIPNLLYNRADCEMDLFPLLTLKYFLEKASYNAMSWDASLSVSYFMETVNELFQSRQYDMFFRDSINYLIAHRLLLRSYDQDQIDNMALGVNNIGNIECVYLSRLAASLWRRLGTTSVFLEMYIDDIWLTNDSRDPTRQQYRGFNSENFDVCLSYMSELIGTEAKIYSQAANNAQSEHRFEDVFGNEPICSYLIKGLETSLTIFFRGSATDDDSLSKWNSPLEKDRIGNWKSEVERLKKKAAHIYTL